MRRWLSLYLGFIFSPTKTLSKKWRWLVESLVGLGVSLGLYLLYRDWITSLRAVEYNSAFYLSPLMDNPLKLYRITALNWPIGIFSVFKLMWVTVFVAGVSLWRSGHRRAAFSLALILACTLFQLGFAKDTSRYVTLGFMAVILSLEHLFRENPGGFRRWVGWLILGSLAIPQLYITGKAIIVMQPLIFSIVAGHAAASLP